MRRLFAVVVLASGIFAVAAPAAGQQESPEVKRLKDENALLKAKLELQAKEIELLKKEIELLKKEGGKGGPTSAGDDRPTATAGGITFTLEKATRNGNKVTLTVAGVSAEADRTLAFPTAEAVDTDGNLYPVKIRSPLGFLTVKFRDGVKTRFEVEIPNVPGKVTEFARVDLAKQKGDNAFAIPDKDPVVFKGVKIGK